MNIKRPSAFIRYTDNELTQEQEAYNVSVEIWCNDRPEEVLIDAAPIWGPSFVKVQDGQ